MAIKGQSITVQYLAWDTSNNTGKTGDGLNHTLRIVKDGSVSTPSGSISECDATNLPGIYKITLTASEMDCNYLTLGGKSSTGNVVIYPLHIVTEMNLLEWVHAVIDGAWSRSSNQLTFKNKDGTNTTRHTYTSDTERSVDHL